jgi:hypothetical protein
MNKFILHCNKKLDLYQENSLTTVVRLLKTLTRVTCTGSQDYKIRRISMRILQTITIVFFLAILPVWLTACGGGGGGSPAMGTISGGVGTAANPGGEPGVTVKGFYLGSSDSTASVLTATNGSYTLTVDRSRSVSVQFSKAGHITLNMEAIAATTDITGFGPTNFATSAYVQGVINTATGVTNILIADKGWLIARAVDAMDNEVPGVSITSTVIPEAEVYTACDGSGSGMSVTVVDMGPPCPVPRDIMYGAYFSTNLPTETDVNVLGEVHTLPIRLGEISTYN